MSTIRILDGGMSRELIRLGAELRQPEWSALALMEAPDVVRRVHEEFIVAGADVITTNSYALVPFHIGEERFRAEGRRLIALAGRLARAAADSAKDRKVLVAGSLPPIFGSYEPHLFRPERVQNYLGVLVEELTPYVDLWLGETLSLVAEAEEQRDGRESLARALVGKQLEPERERSEHPDAGGLDRDAFAHEERESDQRQREDCSRVRVQLREHGAGTRAGYRSGRRRA